MKKIVRLSLIFFATRLVDKSVRLRKKLKKMSIWTLEELGATDEEHAIEYDWEENCAPSMPSGAFEPDLTDAYITKIWNDRGLVKANLHAYYLGEDRFGVDLGDEIYTDWEDILDHLTSDLQFKE